MTIPVERIPLTRDRKRAIGYLKSIFNIISIISYDELLVDILKKYR